MKIWLSKNSEIPLREQLFTQIRIGIASGDLPTGKKLPSTGELSRRFKIHANTISSAYRKLSEEGLIEFRKGSGFYVCEIANRQLNEEIELDTLIAGFFQTAQLQGFSKTEIQNRLQKWFSAQLPEQILVVEPDKNLRDILVEEIKQATIFSVDGVSFEEFAEKNQKTNAIFVALVGEKQKIESVLFAGKTCFFVRANSVSNSIAGKTRPEQSELIAVVSGWEKFLIWSKTILIAAQIENNSIIPRSTGDKNWKKGLKNASMIICDTLAAKNFPNDRRIRIFQMIASDSLNELNDFIHDGVVF